MGAARGGNKIGEATSLGDAQAAHVRGLGAGFDPQVISAQDALKGFLGQIMVSRLDLVARERQLSGPGSSGMNRILTAKPNRLFCAPPDRILHMTESKHQEVLDALNAAMQGKACPMCGGQERTLIDRFSRQDITEIGEPFHSSVGKVVTTTARLVTHPEALYLPFAILVCEKCGLMTYHHLGRLKIAC